MAGGDTRKRKRKRIEDGVDRISELPVHLREHILDRLSIDEAVSTSILSSKWRYCWTGLRKLVFDEDFWDCDGGDSDLVKYFEHAWTIERVLMLHSGPIHEFILFIPLIEDKTVDINVWLRVLSNNGVRKIEIDAYHYQDNSFPIPSCLFHCRELEKLSLCICTLTPPSDFKGFANLTSLSLDNVDVAPRLLESLISRCPLLETLSLEYLVLGEPLALEALNLKTFYFNGGNLKSIIFKNIPKLTCVSLLASDTYNWHTPVPESYIMLNQLCSLSKIKELTFDFNLLETSDTCPSIAPTPLKNLKSLTIRSLDLCLSNEVLFTLYLMRNAPNLQNLTLHLDSEVRRDPKSKKLQGVAAKLLKSEARKHTSYNSLQTIKIGGIKGLRHESLLIKLLQTRCHPVKHSNNSERREEGDIFDIPHQMSFGHFSVSSLETQSMIAVVLLQIDGLNFVPALQRRREHILGCLIINEAVATSVLSSKWRFCWTGLRTLYFDGEFWEAYGGIELAEYLEHARAIDRVLMLHSGPIPEFILYIPEIKDKTVDINVWLRVLSTKGVQTIDLGAYDYHDNSFPIPSCVFHCRELEQLSLSICKLTPPSDFKGFANLTSLSLENVDVAPRLLESLISRCLLLETLSLQNMVLQRPLALEALNLKTFYLDKYKIDTQQPYSTLERLCSLSMIKELTFDFFLLEPLPENCPSSTLTPLENLKCLTLRSVNLCLSDDILFTLCLLGSAPNLQTLTIYLDSKVRGDSEIKEKLHGVAAELLKSETKKHPSYNNLQTIKIKGIEELPNESLLIKLLQTRCQKLKSIIIEKNRFRF
ncbi:unnamed protein product [Rhodiola kirilowii]